MEVMHITCNMCSRDLPDMDALGLWEYISGTQIPCAHVTTITNAPLDFNLAQAL